MKSKRFQVLANRPVNQDGLIGEWPEEGLIAMESPNDPKSSIKIENGIVVELVELDGKKRADFDMIDRFIADYAINLVNAEKAMGLDSLEIAKMLVDINVSRDEIVNVTTAITPSNQCHVTNLKDNPVQIAADAAESGIRGFSGQETTVGIVRYAPFNALAILIGFQVGRGGVLTQCSVEEATELDLGMRGLISYAETVSEALMGYSEGKSMLYLEARCIYNKRGCRTKNNLHNILCLPLICKPVYCM